ncbi:hypothetical protein [Algoriphagus marinus]|uniref:hypothetical protein n=1 Tax=Algoriphagus marinus TaxID=1925762 RepID=UPI00094B8513|nr:hypothetical protein [Algoriphagus marinus]
MNFEGIPNRSAKIKKWESIVFLPIIAIISLSFVLKSVALMLGLLGYTLLSQLFIYRLYKKENRGKEFIIRMSVPFAVCVILFVYLIVQEFV